MTNHDISPEFERHLAWQLESAFRRRDRFARPAGGLHGVRTAALVLLSVTTGAAGALGIGRLQSSRGAELYAARAEVLYGVAEAREAHARQAWRRTQSLTELRVVTDEVLSAARLDLEGAKTELALRDLEREEVRTSGNAVRDDLAAPLVHGRDFMVERLLLALESERAGYEAVRETLRRATNMQAAGVATSREVADRRADLDEAERGLIELEQRVAVRLAVLEGQIPPHQGELYWMREKVRMRAAGARARFEGSAGGEMPEKKRRKLKELSRRENVLFDRIEDVPEDLRKKLQRSMDEYETELDAVRSELELAEIELELIEEQLAEDGTSGAWEPPPRSEILERIQALKPTPEGYDKQLYDQR